MKTDDEERRLSGLEQENEKLTEELTYFKTLMYQLPIGVYRTSRDGRFLLANPALCKILGCTREELKTMRAVDFFANPLARRGQLVEWKAKPGIVTDEIELVTKDGRRIWVRDTGKAILDGNGEVDYFDGVIEDITDRKEALAALRQREEELNQAQKMEALGRLAGGVAHDINNILGVIMGSVSVLSLEVSEDDPLTTDVDNILTACKRGRDLTGSLLDFARKDKYLRSVFSLNRLIGALLELLTHTIPKKITVETDFDPGLAPVEGDWTQLEQSIMNICINSIDAMKGEGRLVIRTRNFSVELDDERASVQLAPGNYVEVTVTDTGSGIDPQTLTHVFEPFFTTKPKGAGTGLGLSMVYNTVRNHRGTVSIKSALGKGTEIRILIPQAQGKGAQDVERHPASRPKFHAEARSTALIIDDEPTILKAHCRMLEHLGFTVLQASNGTEAVAHFTARHRKISVVLLDLVMSDPDGPEIFKRLMEIDKNARVILCSGYTADEKADALLAAGAKGFLHKPFELDTLAEMLSSALA